MSVTAPFNSTELQLIAMFLHDGALEFGASGGNELELLAHAGSVDLRAAILADAGSEADVVYDDWAMSYLAQRCQQQLQNDGHASLWTAAELDVMGEVLHRLYQVHEDQAEPGDYIVSLEIDAASNSLVRTALVDLSSMIARYDDEEHDYAMQICTAAMAAIDGFNPDAEWIDVPDYWLMHYFSKRCSDLVRAGR